VPERFLPVPDRFLPVPERFLPVPERFLPVPDRFLPVPDRLVLVADFFFAFTMVIPLLLFLSPNQTLHLCISFRNRK
jgi:hypothetical protein